MKIDTSSLLQEMARLPNPADHRGQAFYVRVRATLDAHDELEMPYEVHRVPSVSPFKPDQTFAKLYCFSIRLMVPLHEEIDVDVYRFSVEYGQPVWWTWMCIIGERRFYFPLPPDCTVEPGSVFLKFPKRKET